MYTVNFDPVALSIGPLAIHWYALAYLGGFIGGWYYLKHLIKVKGLAITREQLDDYLSYAIAGVLVGGRLGYVLFYQFDYYWQKPLHILYLWQGGMSFHGGLMGVIVATFIFARQNKIDPFFMCDLLAMAGPIGLFFGRLANFVNGELWGRVTSLPVGMIFPNAPTLEPRHPSQLYEAGFEGLLLFTLLWFLAYRTKALQHPGRIGGIFLLGYAISRFVIEFVREPDAQLGFIYAGATMGQLLCVPMGIFGLWVFLRSLRQSKAL